jgi:hypothetical protein
MVVIDAGGVCGYDPAPKYEGRKLRYENAWNPSGLDGGALPRVKDSRHTERRDSSERRRNSRECESMNKISELLDGLNDKFNKAKSHCWFFHRWSKWELYEQSYINQDFMETTVQPQPTGAIEKIKQIEEFIERAKKYPKEFRHPPYNMFQKTENLHFHASPDGDTMIYCNDDVFLLKAFRVMREIARESWASSRVDQEFERRMVGV